MFTCTGGKWCESVSFNHKKLSVTSTSNSEPATHWYSPTIFSKKKKKTLQDMHTNFACGYGTLIMQRNMSTMTHGCSTSYILLSWRNQFTSLINQVLLFVRSSLVCNSMSACSSHFVYPYYSISIEYISRACSDMSTCSSLFIYQ